MRKNAKYMLATLLMFCFVSNVKADECTYEKQVELNNIASTVKATYEEVEIDTGEKVYYMDPETGIEDSSKLIPVTLKGFKTSILNVTKDIYLNVTNNNTNSSKNIYFEDTNNGTVFLDIFEADEIVTYTIKVYGLSFCPGEELRTITLATPIYNDFSELEFCNQYPEFEYCNPYITGEKITLNQFLEESNKYKENNDPISEKKLTNKKEGFVEKIKRILDENKKTIMIVMSIVAIVGVATAAIIVIRRRSRLI